jgi:electron transport complex protein RnfB
MPPAPWSSQRLGEDMITAVVALTSVALVAGLVLAMAARVFAVEVDPRTKEIEEELPGANCGACGLPGCAELAKRIAEGKADVDACPVGGEEVARSIAEIMGVDYAGGKSKKVALVLCSGRDDVAPKQYYYNGVYDCTSAEILFGGDKACPYGCLGMGTCVGVCPFDAIEITSKGVAVVDPEKCTGCGKCIEACPKNIIKLVPSDKHVHILCSSHDKGGKVRKYCSTGCIGCMRCVKEAPEGAIEMDDNLAVINYKKDVPPAVAEVCPTNTIVVSVEKVVDRSDKEVAVGGGG